MAKAFGYLLPSSADTTAPVAEFTYPAELKEVSAVDPVDLEVKGYDERGDVKEVRLFANDTLVKAKRSFPFQFRYYVPASAAANSTITFKAEAEDKAGNVKTITRQVRVVPAAAIAQTPIAVGRPVLTGTPTVGSTLTITNIAFINTPTSTRYVWLRDGAAIAGATKAAYALTTDDLGHLVSARVYAGNADGEGDAETDGLYVSAATVGVGPGRPGPAGARAPPARRPPARPGRRAPPVAGPAGPRAERKADKGNTPNVRITCARSADRRSIVCTITAIHIQRADQGHPADRRDQADEDRQRQGQGEGAPEVRPQAQEGTEGRREGRLRQEPHRHGALDAPSAGRSAPNAGRPGRAGWPPLRRVAERGAVREAPGVEGGERRRGVRAHPRDERHLAARIAVVELGYVRFLRGLLSHPEPFAQRYASLRRSGTRRRYRVSWHPDGR